MENKKIYLFAIRYNDENGFRYGLPFPGTFDSMLRDIRESLKGFDEEMVEHYTVCFLAEFKPEEQYPIFLLDIEEFELPVSQILMSFDRADNLFVDLPEDFFDNGGEFDA